jgi:hypothetical protein
MIISVANTLDITPGVQFSYSSSNLTAGGTSVPLKNINSFTDSWAVQIGKTGEAQSEIAVISGVPATGTINLASTLRFDHSLDTPVFQIHYDRIIFKRSTAGTAGTATAIGTVSITPNSQFTEFNDSSGSTTYAYKTQFSNSVSSDVSQESDWFVPGGPTFYSLQQVRQRGKDALYNASYIKSDEILNDWINEWIEVMTNSAIKVNQGYSMGTTDVSFGTAGLGTITESSFKKANKIEITTDGANFYNSTEIPVNRFSSTDIFSSIYPRHYWQGDTIFGVLPVGDAGTARITYSKLATRLVNDSDELPLSLRSYTTSCIEYVLYRAFDNDMKKEYADTHYQRFGKGQQDFVNEITPRDQTGVKTINFTDSLSSEDDSIDNFVF